MATFLKILISDAKLFRHLLKSTTHALGKGNFIHLISTRTLSHIFHIH